MKDSSIACSGTITLRKISSDGAYGQEYKFYGKNASDTFGPGWYVGNRQSNGSNLVTSENDIFFGPGEGMIVYCGANAANFLVAGSVHLEPMSVGVAKGYSFGGNSTPVKIGLSEVRCLRSTGEEWLRTNMKDSSIACSGTITLRKISSDGAYGQEYKFYGKNASDTFGPGWYVGNRQSDGSNLVTSDNEVEFNPGEGWILYCGATAAQIVVPEPIKIDK